MVSYELIYAGHKYALKFMFLQYIDFIGPQFSTEVGNSAGFLVASQSMQGDSCS